MESALRVIRMANGFEKYELAQLFNTTKQNLYQIEYSERTCRKKTLEKYSEIFSVSVEEIKELIDYANSGADFRSILLKYLEIVIDRPIRYNNPCNVFKIIRFFENLTFEQMAEKIGQKSVRICLLERNEKRVSIAVIENYANAFGLRKADLVYLLEQQEADATVAKLMWIYANMKKYVPKGDNDINSVLEIIRKANDLTREEMATMLGVSLNVVWELENLRKNVEPEIISKYANIFRIDEQELKNLIEHENSSEKLSLLCEYLQIDEKNGNLNTGIVDKDFYPLQILRVVCDTDVKTIEKATNRQIIHIYSVEKKNKLSLNQMSLFAKAYKLELPFLLELLEFGKGRSFKSTLKFCADYMIKSNEFPVKYLSDKECYTAQILRERVGLKRKELASLMGCSASVICRYEAGEYRITLSTFEQYSKVTRIPMKVILSLITQERKGAKLDELRELLQEICRKEKYI